MSDRKIEDNVIREAYNAIIAKQSSLTKKAKELGIDRETLNNYIRNWANENGIDVTTFDSAMRRNFRGNNDGNGRNGRDKKKRAMNSKAYNEAITYLEGCGIKKEFIDEIATKIRKNNEKTTNEKRSHRTIAEDSIPIKIREIVRFFESLNSDIDPKSDVYFTYDDIKDIIQEFPGILNISLQTLTKKYTKMLKQIGDEEGLKKIIKVYPVDFNFGTAEMLKRVKKHIKYLRDVGNELIKFREYREKHRNRKGEING